MTAQPAAQPERESIYKQIGRSTAVYSIAIIAGKMSSFFLLPVYTRYLTPADYGVMELLELTSFIFSALVGMRIGDALFYYYAQARDERGRQQAIWTVFVGSALLGVVGGLAGWLGAPLLSKLVFGTQEYIPYFRLVFTTFAFSLPVETGFCYMRALNRSGAYVKASICRLILAIVLNVVLLAFGFGLYAVLFSSLAVTAIMAGYMGLFSLWGTSSGAGFNRKLMMKFIGYSAPLGISGLSMFIINYGDRFFLQRNVPLAEIGIYSLAYKLGMLVTYIQTPFDVYWRSQMFSIVQAPDGEKIYVRVATYLTLALTFIVVLFALFAGPVLRIMTPPAFWSAAQYVPWIAAAYVIRTVGAHFRCVFLLEGKTSKELHVTSIGAAVCLGGYALLIPPFGLWGAVVSTLLGFATMFVIGLWQAQKLRAYPFEFRRMAVSAGGAAAVAIAFAFMRPDNLWMHIAVGILFAGLYPAVLLMGNFAHSDERYALRSIANAVAGALRSAGLPWMQARPTSDVARGE